MVKDKKRAQKTKIEAFIDPPRDIPPAPPMIRGTQEVSQPEEIGHYLPTIGDTQTIERLQREVDAGRIPFGYFMIVNQDDDSLFYLNAKTRKYTKIGTT